MPPSPPLGRAPDRFYVDASELSFAQPAGGRGLKGLAARAVRAAREGTDRVRPWRVFDRPVFIVATARSGSTLLLDMMASHPGLWSWFDEPNEAWLRAIPNGHPMALGDTWPMSYATEHTRRRAEWLLVREGTRVRRARRGVEPTPRERLGLGRLRYLDKAPANSMRVDVLAALWPDARFIHLHRDGPANVASLIESWDSPLGVRDPLLPDGTKVEWRMLLPEGWVERRDASVAEKCTFQWIGSNESILRGLEDVPPDRRCEVRYDALVANPEETARRLMEFAQVDWHPDVAEFCRRMPPSRVVLSSPKVGKWRERFDELAPCLPSMVELSERLGYATDW